MKYTTDFETNNHADDCRVWAWAVMEIETLNWVHGTTIESYIQYILTLPTSTLYFHNLKFDIQFLISYLLTHGWKHSLKMKLEKNEFSTIISDKNQFYQLKLACVNKKGKIYYITFQDSYKLLPFGVEKIAKDFKLPLLKGKIDYDLRREKGHKLTDLEKEYLHGDVEIMARALKIFFDRGLEKLTIGSNALSFYKTQFGTKNFDRHFPKLPINVDRDIRQTYKGGWTYLKKGYSEIDIGEGIVLDVNSLYPSVLYDCPMPFGEGKFFEGKYKYDKIYPLYVCMISASFDIKKDHLPTLQMKGNFRFNPTEFITSSGDEEVIMCLTSVDLKLFLEHYDVHYIEYLSGWKFRASSSLFKNYIDYWMNEKITAEKNGNNALRQIAKLYLNNLYGKFGKHPIISSKIPVIDVEGKVRYITTEPEEKGGIYIPVACFTTAYARYKTISSAQKVYDRFIYGDTDSLHLIGTELPEGLEIDQYKLGAWKHESTFRRSRFIRSKSYIEDIWNDKINDYELKVTCAGLPKDAKLDVTWDNFHTGFITGKSLKQKQVIGGCVLMPTTFEIKA